MIGDRKDRATFEAANLAGALPSIVRTPSIPSLESTIVCDQWSRQRSRLTLTGSEKTIMSPFEIDKLKIWTHGRISPKDARKGRCSHLPLARQDASLFKYGRSERRKMVLPNLLVYVFL